MDIQPQGQILTQSTATTKNSPIMIGLIVLLVLSFASNAFMGFQLVQLSKNLSQTPTPQSTTNPTINPSSAPKAEMKDYTNTTFGFKFQLPITMTQSKELNDEYNRFVSFTDGKTDIEVSLRKAQREFDPNTYFHMDMPATDTTTLGGELAGIYEAPNGYCDGPGCSKPYVSVVTKKNSDIYALSFFGHAKLTDADKQVIKSFMFQ